MPAGAVPLLEAANTTEPGLKSGFIETLIQESPIMDRIPFMTIQSDSIKHREEVDLPIPEFRNVGGTYTRSYGTDTEVYWGTVILGGEVFVDNYEVRTMGNVVGVKTRQYNKMAKAMARTFDKNFFDGTGTAKDFKGVNTLIGEGHGQLVGAAADAANGGALTLADMDIAHDLMRGVFEAKTIFLNRTHRRKVTDLGRTTSIGYPYIDVGDDRFGRQIMQWGGIPMEIIGDDRVGTAILGFDETRGSETAASSMYFIATSDGGLTGLLGAGGHFEVRDFGETEAAPGHLGRVEAYPGIAIWNKFSVVRLEGITDA